MSRTMGCVLIKAGVLPLLVLAVAGPALAQELGVFDVNDFIDPRELQGSGSGDTAVQWRFLAARFGFGTVEQLQEQNTFTETSAGFLHVTGNYYYSRFQSSVKLIGLHIVESEDCGELLALRARLQQAVYFPWGGSTRESGSIQRTAGRLQAGWEIERVGDGQVSHQFGVAFRARTAVLGRGRPLWVSAFYTRKETADTHYMGVSSSLLLGEWRQGIRLSLSLRVDREHEDFARLVLLRKGDYINVHRIGLSLEIPWPTPEWRIHMSYAPAYNMAEDRENHETAVFLTGPLLARLF